MGASGTRRSAREYRDVDKQTPGRRYMPSQQCALFPFSSGVAHCMIASLSKAQ